MEPGTGRRALITGIAGQDGSYLAELLLAKGYEVHGMLHGGTPTGLGHVAPIARRLALHTGDVCDARSLRETLRASRPDEIYNLAGASSVADSWTDPVAAAETAATGVARLLEAVRELAPAARVYQASSSEIFGSPERMPQDEATPIRPSTPYGAAKAYAHHLTVSYRESYGVHAMAGILYNHESPRRGLEFVTRKVTHAAAAISLGLADELRLGDLDAQRDWGYAPDYVEAMWLMLQQDEPADFVIATGRLHSVRDVVERAFGRVGLDPGEHVRRDPAYLRPADAQRLVGDATHAGRALGWRPQTSFETLIDTMVDSDLAALQAQQRGRGTA